MSYESTLENLFPKSDVEQDTVIVAANNVLVDAYFNAERRERTVNLYTPLLREHPDLENALRWRMEPNSESSRLNDMTVEINEMVTDVMESDINSSVRSNSIDMLAKGRGKYKEFIGVSSIYFRASIHYTAQVAVQANDLANSQIDTSLDFVEHQNHRDAIKQMIFRNRKVHETYFTLVDDLGQQMREHYREMIAGYMEGGVRDPILVENSQNFVDLNNLEFLKITSMKYLGKEMDRIYGKRLFQKFFGK